MKFILIAALLYMVDARPQEGLNIDFAPSSYIIDGQDTLISLWPWQLSMQYLGSSWSHSCGSSVLNSHHALTAAHCIDGRAPANIRLLGGCTDRNGCPNEQIHNAVSLTMHAGYQSSGSGIPNDIAIIRIGLNGFDFSFDSNVAPAIIPESDLNSYTHDSCTITGWGIDASGGLPLILQKADTAVITNADCAARMSSIANADISSSHICVYTGLNSACNGDSGGPLNCHRSPQDTSDYLVVGVTSWVIKGVLPGSCRSSYPSVYTRVSSYLDWIAQNS